MRQVDRRSLAHQAGAMSTENVSCAVRVRRRREGGRGERDRKQITLAGAGEEIRGDGCCLLSMQ